MNNSNGGALRTVIAGVILAIVITGAIVLIVTGNNVDGYLYLLAIMGIPTLAATISAQRAGQAAKTVNTVEELVNGNTTRLMNELENLRAENREYYRRYGKLSPYAESEERDNG